jgi:hypothetical protein
MGRSNNGKQEPKYSLYVNARCASCEAAIFEDEGKRTGDGRLFCRSCYDKEAMREAGVKPLQESRGLPIPGISFLEIILVALILGLLAAVSIPPLLRFKERGQEHALQLKFLLSENPALSTLALDAVEAESEAFDGQIQLLAQAAGITHEDMPAFKADVMKYQEFQSPEAQAGAILQVIEEWKTRVGSSLEQTLEEALPNR